MARLSYDFAIGYDRNVEYDQAVAPEVLTSTLDAGWPAEPTVDLGSSPEPTVDLQGPSDSTADLAASDTLANLGTGPEVIVELEAAE